MLSESVIDLVFQSTVDAILEHTPRRKTSLDKNFRLLETLGNPQRYLEGKTIHVTGTNGKGSVVTKIAAVLSQADVSVGMFTSPHVVCCTERISMQGRRISKSDFVLLGNQVLQACDASDDYFSFFDILTTMMFLYFAEKRPSVVVMEAGIGGRLDATNVLKRPWVTIITSVGWDHRDLLGHTQNEIATEKAGILRPSVPVILGPSASLYQSECRMTCHEVGPLVAIQPVEGESFDAENSRIAAHVFTRAILKTYPIEGVITNLLHSEIAQGVSIRPWFRDHELTLEETQSSMRSIYDYMCLRSVTRQLYMGEEVSFENHLSHMPMEYQTIIQRYTRASHYIQAELSEFTEGLANSTGRILQLLRYSADLMRKVFLLLRADDKDTDLTATLRGLLTDDGTTTATVQDIEATAIHFVDVMDWVFYSLKSLTDRFQQDYHLILYPTPRAIIMDVAHNRSAVYRFLKTTRSRYRDHSIRICFALSGRRDVFDVFGDLSDVFPPIEREDGVQEMEQLGGIHYLQGSNPRLISLMNYKTMVSSQENEEFTFLKSYLQQQLDAHATEDPRSNNVTLPVQQSPSLEHLLTRARDLLPSPSRSDDLGGLVGEAIVSDSDDSTLADSCSYEGTLEQQLYRALALSVVHDEVLVIIGSFYLMEQIMTILALQISTMEVPRGDPTATSDALAQFLMHHYRNATMKTGNSDTATIRAAGHDPFTPLQ